MGQHTQHRSETDTIGRIRKFSSRHPRAWLVGMIVLPLVLFWVAYGVIGKASAAEATADRQCTHSNIDGECWFGAKGSVQHFESGYFQRSHGFPAKKVFAHPVAARKFFVGHLATRIGHLSAQHRSRIAWRYYGSARSPGVQRDGCTSSALCYGCTDYCLAWKMYGTLMARSDCVGHGPPTTSRSTCVYGDHSSITKKGVQRGGSLVICGTAVVIGVLGAPESLGSSVVLAGGITGAVGCGWSFWGSFG